MLKYNLIGVDKMSLCLRYLWIKEYSCLKNTNFQFDEKYEFTYLESENRLDIKSCEMHSIKNFWDEDGRFMNIHAVVGSNGYGKTTFLRAIMAIFTQIYPYKNQTAEEYKHSAYTCPALMIVEDEEKQVYKMLCMGIEIAQSVSEMIQKIEIVNDKMKIRDILYKVKLAFFSNAFDYRDYSEPKAEHISDYSFGGLLRGDYYKQVAYQREDRYDDSVSEQFYHNIYRQVSFMTEFYAKLCDEDQKRMFQSWPEYLHIRFRERRGIEKEKLCFYGVFENVLKKYVDKSDKHTGGHGISPYVYVNKRLERLLCNKQSELEKTFDKIRYRLCRESFQNLLSIDAYKSFYQTPDYKELGEELEPIVEIICNVIDQFGDVKNEHIDFQTKSIFVFYESIQKLLEQAGENITGRVGTIAAYYAGMFKSILLLPEKMFRYANFDKTGEFYFEIRNKDAEHMEQFSLFLNQYKKIVLPFSFLSFDWGMSSGENNMLSLYAQLFAMREVEIGTNYHTERILNYVHELKDKDQKVDCMSELSDTVWILLDEADLTFHPAWQVEFISNLTCFFPKILPDKHLKLQVIFTTHSPILLGDMPRQNVIYMIKKGNNICSLRNFSKNTFGQNLYMLFQDSFFVDGPMGRFASDKMMKISEELLQIRGFVEKLYDKKSTIKKQKVENYLKNLDCIRQKMHMFGDKVVVHKWMDLADVCQYRLEVYIKKEGVKDEISYIHEEIERLNAKKEWLENQIISLESGEK